jgi:hypothetical protein
MKHHRAKAPFEAVQNARWWYDNSCMGYESLARLINETYSPKEINQDWTQPRVEVVAVSTMRDWINETRAYR